MSNPAHVVRYFSFRMHYKRAKKPTKKELKYCSLENSNNNYMPALPHGCLIFCGALKSVPTMEIKTLLPIMYTRVFYNLSLCFIAAHAHSHDYSDFFFSNWITFFSHSLFKLYKDVTTNAHENVKYFAIFISIIIKVFMWSF